MKRFLNSGLFGVALICFFLPFFNIKCNNTKIITVSGVQMATGAQLNPAGGGMFDRMGDTAGSSADRKKMFEIPVLLALLTVLAGTVVTLVLTQKNKDKKSSQWAMYLSAVTLVLLLAEAVSLTVQFSDLDKKGGEIGGIISWHFDIGYWLVTLISLGLIIYNIMELKKINATPSADDSGFPTAPPGMDV